jgi:hypothetical protein
VLELEGFAGEELRDILGGELTLIEIQVYLNVSVRSISCRLLMDDGSFLRLVVELTSAYFLSLLPGPTEIRGGPTVLHLLLLLPRSEPLLLSHFRRRVDRDVLPIESSVMQVLH